MTDQQQKIHAALHAANGDRVAVCLALGMDPLKLKDAIHNCPELKKMWGRSMKAAPPQPVDAIDRTSVLVDAGLPIPAQEQKLALALTREDAKFKTDFSKFPGFSAKEVDYVASLASFHGRHFAKTVDLLTGGMSVTAVRVQLRIEKLGEQLAIGDFSGEEGLERQKMLLQHYVQLCDVLVKMTQTAANGAAIRAKIAVWKKQAEDGLGKQRGKAGFSPLQAQKTEITAQPGSTINVTTTEQKP